MADVEISTSGQKIIYMRHKLCVSRYGGESVLVCGILGGGCLPWALPLLALGSPDGD